MKNIKTRYLLLGLIILLIGTIMVPIINRQKKCLDCTNPEIKPIPKEPEEEQMTLTEEDALNIVSIYYDADYEFIIRLNDDKYIIEKKALNTGDVVMEFTVDIYTGEMEITNVKPENSSTSAQSE